MKNKDNILKDKTMKLVLIKAKSPPYLRNHPKDDTVRLKNQLQAYFEQMNNLRINLMK